LNGRSANNNNSNDETTESSNQVQSDNADSATSSQVNTEEGNQERESDNTTQSQAERSQQDQSQSPFGTFRYIAIQQMRFCNKMLNSISEYMSLFLDTVFNLPNNVEVLMEVSSESNIDTGSSNEQNASGNENNNNARKLTLLCIT